MFPKKIKAAVGSGLSMLMGNSQRNQLNTGLANDLNGLCPYGNNVRIYADTCTLLHSYGMSLLDAVESVFPLNRQQLLVPASVLYELENVGIKDSSKYQACQEAIEKVVSMEANDTVRIILTNSPKFSDAGFISRFVSEVQSNDLVLLTQDRQLAQKAMQLTSFLDGCIQSIHEIRAFYLTAYGSLAQHEREKENHYETSKIQHDEQRSYPRFFLHA